MKQKTIDPADDRLRGIEKSGRRECRPSRTPITQNGMVVVLMILGLVSATPWYRLHAQLIPEGGKKSKNDTLTVTPTPNDSATIEAYKAQRADEQKKLAAAQAQLDDLKRQRAEVESQLAIASATAAEARSKTLLMSDQVTALRGLDSLLMATENELTSQRDRLLGLRDAVGRHASGQLVILIRADSASGTPHLDSLRVLIDSAPSGERRYTARANMALGEGAIDEIYHSSVLPDTHDVVVWAAVGGAAPAAQTATVTIGVGSTTYIEFMLHGMQWTESSWTTAGATP